MQSEDPNTIPGDIAELLARTPKLTEEDMERLRRAAAALGRVGGSTKSEAKAAAARENGKRGGRPPKQASTNTAQANRDG